MKYNKQRNLGVSITRKAKRSYYENLDLKDITDSKKFWATVKPLFSNKIKSTEYITLEENGKIITNDKELARIFNKFFVNIVANLGINTKHSFLINTDNENDPIEKAIAKCKNHSSIILIKKFMENSDFSFSFQHAPKDKITKTIDKLGSKKVVQSNDIPNKLIKSFSGFFSVYIYISILKSASKTENTLKTLKKRKCVPCTKKMVGKKKVTTDLLVFFQVFQKFTKGVYMFRSMIFLKITFLDINADFVRVSIPKMHYFSMVGKMLLTRNKKEVCGVILTDLSKAIGCISHDLFIAKLNAYGFDQNALNVIHNYLSGRSQKAKVGSCFSDLLDILYGLPQGSILALLLFNIDLCDLFLSEYSSEFSNFADDTTPYECG